MRFAAYALLMICIGIVFYMLGLTEPMVSLYDSQGGYLQLNCPEDAGVLDNQPSQCGDTFFSIMVTTLSMGALGIVISALTGYSAIYIIPIILIYVFLNIFVFPFSVLLNPEVVPTEVAVILTVIINAISALGILSFIRGSV